MHRSLIFLITLLFFGQVMGQKWTTGKILYDSLGSIKPAKNVHVLVMPSGDTAVTNAEGKFKFRHLGNANSTSVFIFTYFDIYKDTIAFIPDRDNPEFLIANYYLPSTSNKISQVEIVGSNVSSKINSRGIRKTEILNEGEFKKAACCTLSESFETNNTVEVSNADGVSGIRQVEMLGLAGKYVHMTRDNIPTIRGLNVLNGLDQIPGPMVGGVHIAKGAGSVTNGYEGITGGLNFTLKSEPDEPRLFLNGYINSQGRTEGNLIASQRINKNSFNHAYLHYQNRFKIHDKGGDGFTDIPLSQMIYFGDMFKYYGNKTEGQVGFNYTKGIRDGGDIHDFHKGITMPVVRFHFTMEEERSEAFAKLGIFLNKDGSSSIGNILLASQTKSKAILNNLIGRNYEGIQKNLSYTGLYATPDHKMWSFKSGINLVYDQVTEIYNDSFGKTLAPLRNEFSAGAFTELVYLGTKLNWILGTRIDHHNLYGPIFTPRFHLKYDVTKQQQLHVQAGVGRRTPWIFADNLPNLISNRRLIINPAQNSKFAYGLPQEHGINAGISYTWHLMVFKLPSTISADGFYTYFINQTVADRDTDPGLLIIENQSGNATSMGQLDWNLKPHRRIDIKLSYRYVNSQMVLGGATRLQTMQAPHRGLLVAGYETRTKWYFDGIVQVNSKKRLPITSILSETNSRPTFSPAYTIVNFQIRKDLKRWELYAGCENILNVYQKNPVLNVDENGREYFDAAFAWGPTMGRNFYFGFRYKFK